MDPHPWEAPASSHPPTERDPVQARDFALMKDQHHWCALSHGPQAAPMLVPHALHAGAPTPKDRHATFILVVGSLSVTPRRTSH
jgi:hypothetical protein